MERFARTLNDYAKDHQWVRLLGWTENELESVPIHGQATSHDVTTEIDEYLNLANFGNTGLGVTSLAAGGGTSANVRSIENVYVYREDTPPELFRRLQVLIDGEGPPAHTPGIFGEEESER